LIQASVSPDGCHCFTVSDRRSARTASGIPPAICWSDSAESRGNGWGSRLLPKPLCHPCRESRGWMPIRPCAVGASAVVEWNAYTGRTAALRPIRHLCSTKNNRRASGAVPGALFEDDQVTAAAGPLAMARVGNGTVILRVAGIPDAGSDTAGTG